MLHYSSPGMFDARQELSQHIVQIAINKTKGDLAGAAQALRTYLDSFSSDKDAWEELADIYTEVFP